MSRIIVDASVARAAGGLHREAPSGPCSAALEAVMRHKHLAVFSPTILEEWQRHQSSFSRQWLKSMFARRQVYRTKTAWQGVDRVRTAAGGLSKNDENAVTKDLHLVEAAMLTDRRVISEDRAQALLLRTLVPLVPELGDLVWVPAGDGAVEAWLNNRAATTGHRLRDTS